MNFGSAKAIIFDLGKVLIDFSIDRACSQVAHITGSSPESIHTFLFAEGREAMFERGLLTFPELHAQFESYLGLRVDPAILKHAASDIFEPVHESIHILKSLHSRHQGARPLILLSNTNEIHWEHIEKRWQMSQWFDDLVLSFEVKAMKPDVEIYREAIKKSGVGAFDCFFVDDVPANIEGARRCGMDAVLFEGPQKLLEDLQLRGIWK